jgi:hypothetical protein
MTRGRLSCIVVESLCNEASAERKPTLMQAFALTLDSCARMLVHRGGRTLLNFYGSEGGPPSLRSTILDLWATMQIGTPLPHMATSLNADSLRRVLDAGPAPARCLVTSHWLPSVLGPQREVVSRAV